MKVFSRLFLIVALSLMASTVWAANVTFQLSQGAQATPSAEGFSTFYFEIQMNYHVNQWSLTKSCRILWNQDSCTITGVNGSGDGMGLYPYLVEIFWYSGTVGPNPDTILGKTSFWIRLAGNATINVPVGLVTFSLDGDPGTNNVFYYLMSSEEVNMYGSPSMPNSLNSAVGSHQVGTLTWGNRDGLSLPVLAGCYTVAMLQKDDAPAGFTAAFGGLDQSRVLCVDEFSAYDVRFGLTPRTVEIFED